MDPFSPGCLESVTPNHWLSLSSTQVFPQGSPAGLPTTCENNVIISYLENHVTLGEQRKWTHHAYPQCFFPSTTCEVPKSLLLSSSIQCTMAGVSYVTVSYLVQMCFLKRWFLFVEMTGRGGDRFTPTQAVQNQWQRVTLGEEFHLCLDHLPSITDNIIRALCKTNLVLRH